MTADGRRIQGIVADGNGPNVTLVDAENRRHTFARGDLESLKPMDATLMPEGSLDKLSDQQLRDLFAFLQSDPPPI